MHIDDVVELEKQLSVRAGADLGGAKPFEDFREQRRTRQHVELERKDVGAVHLDLFIPAFFGPVTM
jgi:hypothetical protein